MGREVERKYLVKNALWRREADRGIEYRQGYLCLDPRRGVRVRLGGEKAILTVKGQSEGSARDEFEFPIPAADAEELLERICIQPIIEKTRYQVHRGDLTWEIDEFAGENRGLLIAEVETDKPPQQIPIPEWAGEDVTDDPRYFNTHLVKQPYSQWKQPVGT